MNLITSNLHYCMRVKYVNDRNIDRFYFRDYNVFEK